MNGEGPLVGLRVLDLSHQYSGALTACLLADLGAEVIAVEHPGGSPIRTMLPKKDGESLWWKVLQRGKKAITLNLSTERGRELMLRLARRSEVMVENFRPGTLERWRIGPKDLEAEGVSLILLRTSGFGQTGPDSGRPGFGTVAEAMSGFAYLNGFPDGPPVFPSVSLADGVAATFGAFGLMAALCARLRGQDGTGVRVVDVALFEGLFRLVPTQVQGYDLLGYVPKRPGNLLSSHGVLRNLYRSADGEYFIISAVGDAVIRRCLEAAEAQELIQRIDRGAMHRPQEEVVAFIDDCNAAIECWSRKLPYKEVAERLARADAVFQHIYNVEDIVNDEHYRARGDLIPVPDEKLGSILMPGVVPKISGQTSTPAHAGPSRGAHNDQVYGEMLGLDRQTIERLRENKII